MTRSIRDLEEDEVKIDNLLSKVLRSCILIESLNKQINSTKDMESLDKKYVLERVEKIDILIKTVMNLVTLADDIDITDETIAEDLRKDLKDGLNRTINNIKEIDQFLEKEDPEK